MKLRNTFLSAGWDFWNTWEICEETNYPVLQWQIPAADFLCPDGVNFIDFTFFADPDHWGRNNCNEANGYCDGTDLDQSGVPVAETVFVIPAKAGIQFFALDPCFRRGDIVDFRFPQQVLNS
jgi:hypothetical protein